jgi:hypothetical protein
VLELRKAIGYQRGVGTALIDTGDIHLRSGRPGKALNCWREALTIFTGLGYQVGVDQVSIRFQEQ